MNYRYFWMPFWKPTLVIVFCTALTLAGCMRNKTLSEKANTDNCPGFANTYWSAPARIRTQPFSDLRGILQLNADGMGKSTSIYKRYMRTDPDHEYRMHTDTLITFFEWTQDCNEIHYVVSEHEPGAVLTWIHRNDSLFLYDTNNPDSLLSFLVQVADSIPLSSTLSPEAIERTHKLLRKRPWCFPSIGRVLSRRTVDSRWARRRTACDQSCQDRNHLGQLFCWGNLDRPWPARRVGGLFYCGR